MLKAVPFVVALAGPMIIIVYYATAGNFGFGLANYTSWDTTTQLIEYTSATDLAKAGTW